VDDTNLAGTIAAQGSLAHGDSLWEQITAGDLHEQGCAREIYMFRTARDRDRRSTFKNV
jgi:hypothetical protein